MPLIALVANGLPPVQLTQTHLTKAGLSASLFPSVRQQASALVNFIKERAEHKLWPVTKTEQLHDMCVDKSRFCAVVLYHGDLKLDDKRALKSILPEFRTIHFVGLLPACAPPHSAYVASTSHWVLVSETQAPTVFLPVALPRKPVTSPCFKLLLLMCIHPLSCS